MRTLRGVDKERFEEPFKRKPMAEDPDVSDRHLGEFEKEITCVLCHGHYKEAKLLPCMHCYCRTCIEELAERSRGQPFPCPECQKDTTLPSGGTEQLQSAFYVDRMKDLYEKMAKAEGKLEAMCEQCSTGEAVAFCRHCTEFICAECVRQHQKLKVFSGHRVMTLEDLRCGGPLDIPLKEAPPPTCPQHDLPKKIFCFDCNQLACRECVLHDHRKHKSNFVKKCAAKSRESLSASLTQLKSAHSNIKDADKKLDAILDQMDAQGKEICQTIKESFDKMKSMLELREKELLNEVMTLVQKKKTILIAQKNNLQSVVRDIQSLVAFVDRSMNNASDQDLVVTCAQLQVKMKKEENLNQQTSLEPATTAAITYDPPSPETILQDLGEVFRLSSQPSLNIRDSSQAQLDKPFIMILKVPNCRKPTIQAELKSLVYPSSSVQADVVQKEVGVYNIICTPVVRGRHDLTVEVNGKVARGSPFRVFVKIYPTQMGPPIRSISRLNQPWGISFNNKHQLMVADCDGKMILVLERDAKRVQNIWCDQFQKPCAVATDHDGAVYVTDWSAQCLFKFGKEGRLLKSVRNELKCPYFIKNIKNQLYVSDYDNEQVKIFDTNCNVIQTISTRECPKPYDIAGCDNCLYVVGGDKIGVYSQSSGDFIRYVNIKPSSVKLSHPRGICFDCSGHLFVTQVGFDLGVFKSSGDHVATFSSASREMSGRPAGIAIDEDGFVYVCDFLGGNVTVF